MFKLHRNMQTVYSFACLSIHLKSKGGRKIVGSTVETIMQLRQFPSNLGIVHLIDPQKRVWTVILWYEKAVT